MKKAMTFLVAVSLMFSIGSAPFQTSGPGNDWDDVPDVLLPVRTR